MELCCIKRKESRRAAVKGMTWLGMISSAYLSAVTNCPSIDMQASASPNIDSSSYHQTTSSALGFFLNEYRLTSSVPFSPNPNMSNVALQKELGPVCKHDSPHFTSNIDIQKPISFGPHGVLGSTEYTSQPTCKQTTHMKPVSFCYDLTFSSNCQRKPSLF
ncbi:hypothetical protein TNCV_4731601 [Trichonephila clavipes]|nr:hypothetical protein TNCV_4731601 [Trichonephila clavipes]